MKYWSVAVSVIIGLALFTVLFLFAGVEQIIEKFSELNLLYLGLFFLSAFLLYLVYVFRWFLVLRYQGTKVSFFKVFKYKTIGHSVSYLTPFAMIGGEPLKAILLRKSLKGEKKGIFSSILLEGSIGLSIDLFIIAFAIVTIAVISAVSQMLLLIGLVMLMGFLVWLYFYALAKNKGPFSSVLKLVKKIVPLTLIDDLIKNTLIVESEMNKFLTSNRKNVLKVVLVSALSWPLTFLQYKFALSSLGHEDISVITILLSILATGLSFFSPVPASFGTQEASHFVIFGFLKATSTGIALSLIIRSKDIILTLIGIIFVSNEGIGFLEAMKKTRK